MEQTQQQIYVMEGNSETGFKLVKREKQTHTLIGYREYYIPKDFHHLTLPENNNLAIDENGRCIVRIDTEEELEEFKKWLRFFGTNEEDIEKVLEENFVNVSCQGQCQSWHSKSIPPKEEVEEEKEEIMQEETNKEREYEYRYYYIPKELQGADLPHNIKMTVGKDGRCIVHIFDINDMYNFKEWLKSWGCAKDDDELEELLAKNMVGIEIGVQQEEKQEEEQKVEEEKYKQSEFIQYLQNELEVLCKKYNLSTVRYITMPDINAILRRTLTDMHKVKMISLLLESYNEND